MKLRVHIEFIGSDKVKITKFSGIKTISVKDLIGGGKVFDFDTFTFVDGISSDYGLQSWGGNGTISNPYELMVIKRNYDNMRYESRGTINAKSSREITVEETLMPESLKKIKKR
jgi:hypothetical protein